MILVCKVHVTNAWNLRSSLGDYSGRNTRDSAEKGLSDQMKDIILLQNVLH